MKNYHLDRASRRVDSLSVVSVNPRDIVKSGVSLSHQGVPITGRAFTDLCNAFALQYSIIGGQQASDEWDKQHPRAWRDLSRALSQFRGKEGLPAVLDSSRPDAPSIVRILGRKQPSPDLLSFLRRGVESTACYASDHPTHSLDSCRVDLDHLDLTSVFTDTESSISVLRGDTYRLGSVFQFGQSSTLMRPSLLRLICANGLTVMVQASLRRLNGRSTDLFRASVSRVDPFHEVRDFLRHGVKSMRETNASVYEVLRVASLSDPDHRATVLPSISKITDAYQRHGLDGALGSRTQSWQRQANSGVNSYDLFNAATSNASHTGLPDEPRNQLNLLASKMLTEGPDLANRPPDPFASTPVRRHP